MEVYPVNHHEVMQMFSISSGGRTGSDIKSNLAKIYGLTEELFEVDRKDASSYVFKEILAATVTCNSHRVASIMPGVTELNGDMRREIMRGCAIIGSITSDYTTDCVGMDENHRLFRGRASGIPIKKNEFPLTYMCFDRMGAKNPELVLHLSKVAGSLPLNVKAIDRDGNTININL